MGRILFIAIAILIHFTANAQLFEWAKSIGSRTHDQGYSVVTDGKGNVYITGDFWGTADFDPGPKTANLTSVGWSDIFFAKYDAGGNYLWAKSIGSNAADAAYSIATDRSGNIYITGLFYRAVDFDPGPAKAYRTSAGKYDIFFAKYDASGNYLWAKNIGGASDDFGRSISTDANGNVYITGAFRGRFDFIPGAKGTHRRSVGGTDIFIAKYDTDGNGLWVKTIGSTGDDYGTNITTDGSGNIYVTGRFQETADFDPGAEKSNLTAVGGADIFFAKYDSGGKHLWSKSIGSLFDDKGSGIVTDGSGNVYITGHFYGTADFDPGPGTANLIGAGWEDIYFAKYDSDGNYLWAKNIGSATDDGGTGIATDGSGNVYITGYFSVTPDFDLGPRTANLTSFASKDIFLAKYNGDGKYLWAKSIGGKGSDVGRGIAFDPTGKVCITGSFQRTANFDPDAGTTKLTSVGLADIFFTQYDAGAVEKTVTVQEPVVSKKIEKEVKEKEVLMKEALVKQTEEMLSQSKVARNVQTNVKAEVVEQIDEKGEAELNLKVKYEYQVIKAVIATQTDDYTAGEYRLSQSNAAKVILYVLKSTIENELQEYLMPETKVTIKITGSTDASPVTGKIRYGGEYGWFKEEFAFTNGMLENITITKESGITSNEQLAFLRTYGVRKFMEDYVSPLRVTDNKFEHYAFVSKKSAHNTGEYQLS